MKKETKKGTTTSPINIVVPRKNVKPEIESPELFGRKKLKYNGGPIIPNVEVFTIFLGSGWMKEPNHPLTLQINNFFTTILVSHLIDELKQYSIPKSHQNSGTTIGYGKLTGSLSLSIGGTSKTIDDAFIQTLIQKWIAAGVIPTPNANTLFFIYIDQSITVTMNENASCDAFCGYHNNVTNTNIYYAVMPFPGGCSSCTGSMSVIDAITGLSSHELCEVITDPIPGTGWYNDIYGEVADICAWQFKTLDGYNVQLEYSNKQRKCV